MLATPCRPLLANIRHLDVMGTPVQLSLTSLDGTSREGPDRHIPQEAPYTIVTTSLSEVGSLWLVSFARHLDRLVVRNAVTKSVTDSAGAIDRMNLPDEHLNLGAARPDTYRPFLPLELSHTGS